jgi:hypothetical protein
MSMRALSVALSLSPYSLSLSLSLSVFKMALKDARLTLGLHVANSFVAAFSGKILCGFVKNDVFIDKNVFAVHHFKFVQFYTILIQVLNLTVNGPYSSDKIDFFEDVFWIVQSPGDIVLLIGDLPLPFGIETLYQFIDSFSKLLFFTLPILQSEMLLFQLTSTMEISEIIKMKELEYAMCYLKSLKDKNSPVGNIAKYKAAVLLNHYCPIILVYKKLRSICNVPLFENIVEAILKAN